MVGNVPKPIKGGVDPPLSINLIYPKVVVPLIAPQFVPLATRTKFCIHS